MQAKVTRLQERVALNSRTKQGSTEVFLVILFPVRCYVRLTLPEMFEYAEEPIFLISFCKFWWKFVTLS
jgi:hypothetical protein